MYTLKQIETEEQFKKISKERLYELLNVAITFEEYDSIPGTSPSEKVDNVYNNIHFYEEF